MIELFFPNLIAIYEKSQQIDQLINNYPLSYTILERTVDNRHPIKQLIGKRARIWLSLQKQYLRPQISEDFLFVDGKCESGWALPVRVFELITGVLFTKTIS